MRLSKTFFLVVGCSMSISLIQAAFDQGFSKPFLFTELAKAVAAGAVIAAVFWVTASKQKR